MTHDVPESNTKGIKPGGTYGGGGLRLVKKARSGALSYVSRGLSSGSTIQAFAWVFGGTFTLSFFHLLYALSLGQQLAGCPSSPHAQQFMSVAACRALKSLLLMLFATQTGALSAANL